MIGTDTDGQSTAGMRAVPPADGVGHDRLCGCASDADGAPPVAGQPSPGSMAPCAPCVARLSPLSERVAAIQRAIEAEAEPLVTITHLLQLCRDEHPLLWERVNGADGLEDQVTTVLAGVRALLPDPATATEIGGRVRRALAAALTSDKEVPAVVVARALAELVDERFGHSFAASFRRRSPYQPGVGDPVPLDSPDLRLVTSLPATSPPWRLANRLDETQHVRLAGEWATQFQVVFDYSLADLLTGLMSADTIIATCHPNRTLAEFDFPLDARGRRFPIRPADQQQQVHVLDRLIGTAVAAGASVVVLPELCVTQSIAARLQDWTHRADGPRLLVAGSYHHEDTHPTGADEPHVRPPRRRNTAVAYVRNSPSPLTNDKHSPADQPVSEDIQPQGWPQIRVYVSCDGWHLVMAICRDLLNPHAVHALAEAGVNLVLVPAMSETLVAFGGPVAHLVGSAQAFVAVANNPADFADAAELGSRRPARALFGHPGFGQQTKLVQPVGGEPGVSLLRVGTGQLSWIADNATEPEQGRTQTAVLPRWAAQLTRQTVGASRLHDQAASLVTLKAAAVLVLLTDSPDGPAVLLTERAPDLALYPGQLVFPGGATEDGDDGPVSTALREASEEIGLDPASVIILGVLPALALPDSGYLLTPVLAWSPRPRCFASMNVAEVSGGASLSLRQLAQAGARPWLDDPMTFAIGEETEEPHLGILGVVTRVVVDLVTGMLARTVSEPPHVTAARELERQQT